MRVAVAILGAFHFVARQEIAMLLMFKHQRYYFSLVSVSFMQRNTHMIPKSLVITETNS